MADSTLYVISEESLYEAMRLIGVQQPFKFACQCGQRDCTTWALFGVGTLAAAGDQVRVHATGAPPPETRVLWVALSLAYSAEWTPIVGIDANDASWVDVVEHASKGFATGILMLLAEQGLGALLDDQHRLLRAS